MSSKTGPKQFPACFGELDVVFPQGENGFRSSPQACLVCEHKTACLRAAMEGEGGLKVRESVIDRAYAAGMVGFFERWSKKKEFHRKIKNSKREGFTKGRKS